MGIELDPNRQKGRKMARYVREKSGDRKNELREQENAWNALLAELDALPSLSAEEGDSASVEHDEILYGGLAPRSCHANFGPLRDYMRRRDE